MNETVSAITIDAELVEEMRAHILACLPEEACGLVGGQRSGTEAAARIVIPVENVLHSPVRFRMDPMAQLGAFNRLDALGLELVGIFHSHPTGPDSPSATDLAEFYYPGTAFLIWSPDGDGWKLRAFEITGLGTGEALHSVVIPIQVGKP